MIYIGIVMIVSATVGILYVAFKFEDYFIELECRAFGKVKDVVKVLRHRLGRWLLRDLERRPMSEETRERIAFEYAADNGIIFTKKAQTGAKTTSDEAFKNLLIKIEGDK